MDPFFNFGYATINNAPGSGGTEIEVQSGQGARFPSTGTYNCTVRPVGEAATATNAEIVRVISRTGDVLKVTRAQEGTTAKNIAAGYVIFGGGSTAKSFTDLEALAAGGGSATSFMQTSTTGVIATIPSKKDASPKVLKEVAMPGGEPISVLMGRKLEGQGIASGATVTAYNESLSTVTMSLNSTLEVPKSYSKVAAMAEHQALPPQTTVELLGGIYGADDSAGKRTKVRGGTEAFWEAMGLIPNTGAEMGPTLRKCVAVAEATGIPLEPAGGIYRAATQESRVEINTLTKNAVMVGALKKVKAVFFAGAGLVFDGRGVVTIIGDHLPPCGTLLLKTSVAEGSFICYYRAGTIRNLGLVAEGIPAGGTGLHTLNKEPPKLVDGVVQVYGGTFENVNVGGLVRYGFVVCGDHFRLLNCKKGGWASICFPNAKRATGGNNYFAGPWGGGAFCEVFFEPKGWQGGDIYEGENLTMGVKGGDAFYKPESQDPGEIWLEYVILKNFAFEYLGGGIAINDDMRSVISRFIMQNCNSGVGEDGVLSGAKRGDVSKPRDALFKAATVDGVKIEGSESPLQAVGITPNTGALIRAGTAANSNSLGNLPQSIQQLRGLGQQLVRAPNQQNNTFQFSEVAGSTLHCESAVLASGTIQRYELLQNASSLGQQRVERYQPGSGMQSAGVALSSGTVVEPIEFTAKTTNGTAVLTEVTAFAGLTIGMNLTGTPIPGRTLIKELKPLTNEIVLNKNATASNASAKCLVKPWIFEATEIYGERKLTNCSQTAGLQDTAKFNSGAGVAPFGTIVEVEPFIATVQLNIKAKGVVTTSTRGELAENIAEGAVTEIKTKETVALGAVPAGGGGILIQSKAQVLLALDTGYKTKGAFTLRFTYQPAEVANLAGEVIEEVAEPLDWTVGPIIADASGAQVSFAFKQATAELSGQTVTMVAGTIQQKHLGPKGSLTKEPSAGVKGGYVQHFESPGPVTNLVIEETPVESLYTTPDPLKLHWEIYEKHQGAELNLTYTGTNNVEATRAFTGIKGWTGTNPPIAELATVIVTSPIPELFSALPAHPNILYATRQPPNEPGQVSVRLARLGSAGFPGGQTWSPVAEGITGPSAPTASAFNVGSGVAPGITRNECFIFTPGKGEQNAGPVWLTTLGDLNPVAKLAKTYKATEASLEVEAGQASAFEAKGTLVVPGVAKAITYTSRTSNVFTVVANSGGSGEGGAGQPVTSFSQGQVVSLGDHTVFRYLKTYEEGGIHALLRPSGPLSPTATLTKAAAVGATKIEVASAAGFPEPGYLVGEASPPGETTETLHYTSITGGTVFNLTSGVTVKTEIPNGGVVVPPASGASGAHVPLRRAVQLEKGTVAIKATTIAKGAILTVTEGSRLLFQNMEVNGKGVAGSATLEPPAWKAAHAYTIKTVVVWLGLTWLALKATTTTNDPEPGTEPATWVLSSSVAAGEEGRWEMNVGAAETTTTAQPFEATIFNEAGGGIVKFEWEAGAKSTTCSYRAMVTREGGVFLTGVNYISGEHGEVPAAATALNIPSLQIRGSLAGLRPGPASFGGGPLSQLVYQQFTGAVVTAEGGENPTPEEELAVQLENAEVTAEGGAETQTVGRLLGITNVKGPAPGSVCACGALANGEQSAGATKLKVDATAGFPAVGWLLAWFSDGSPRFIQYTGLNATEFTLASALRREAKVNGTYTAAGAGTTNELKVKTGEGAGFGAEEGGKIKVAGVGVITYKERVADAFKGCFGGSGTSASEAKVEAYIEASAPITLACASPVKTSANAAAGATNVEVEGTANLPKDTTLPFFVTYADGSTATVNATVGGPTKLTMSVALAKEILKETVIELAVGPCKGQSLGPPTLEGNAGIAEVTVPTNGNAIGIAVQESNGGTVIAEI